MVFSNYILKIKMNKTSSVVLLALLGQADTKKCPFGFGGSDDDSAHPKVESNHPVVGAYLVDSMVCSAGTAAATTSTSFGNTEYQAVVDTI